MAWIATAAVVIGGSMQAYGQYQAGQAAQDVANYNAKLAENEAIAREQATRSETERIRSEKEKMTARQRAGYAKTGAVITEGTPLLAVAEEAGLMELDILQAQRTGMLQAGASRSQAVIDRWSGKQAARAGIIGAGSTLLSGAATAIKMMPRDPSTGKMYLGKQTGKG